MSVPLSLCLCMSVSFCFSVTGSASLCGVCVSVTVHLFCRSVYLFLCNCIFMCPRVVFVNSLLFLILCIHVYISVIVCLCQGLFLCYVSGSMGISVSVCLGASPCVCVFVYLCVCIPFDIGWPIW